MFDVTRGLDDELDCTLSGSKNALGQGRHLQLSAILMAGLCYYVFITVVTQFDCIISGPGSHLIVILLYHQAWARYAIHNLK